MRCKKKMKKNIIRLLLVCLAVLFSISAAATETDPIPTPEDPQPQVAIGVTGIDNLNEGAYSQTLTVASEDEVSLFIFAHTEKLISRTVELPYSAAAFRYCGSDIISESNGLRVQVEPSDGLITIRITVADDATIKGDMISLAMLHFEVNAEPDAAVSYEFALRDAAGQDEDTAEVIFSTPVKLKVDHAHSYGEWERIETDSDDGVERYQASCTHCGLSKLKEVYTVSLADNATEICLNEEEKLLYRIKPGTKAAELLSKLFCEGDVRVFNPKNGTYLSAEDVVATGMQLVVFDALGERTEGETAVSVWGDADCDGKLSASDARKVLRMSVRLENDITPAVFEAADTEEIKNSEKTKVSASDARYILRCAVRLDAFYEVYAEKVQITNGDFTMYTGNTATLQTVITGTPTLSSLTWTVSDPSVLRVNNGTVTALKAGQTAVTVTARGGACATCNITVLQGIESVTLRRVNHYLIEGKDLDLNEQITAVFPADAVTSGAVWTCDNKSFTVSSSGVVKCNAKYADVSNKTAIVTVTYPCTKQVHFVLTLLPADASYGIIGSENLTFFVGKTFGLNADVPTGTTINLVSSNEKVLKKTGPQTFEAVGPGTVQVRCDGVSYSTVTTITIYGLQIANVSLSKSAANSPDTSLDVYYRNLTGNAIPLITFNVTGYDKNGNKVATVSCQQKDLAYKVSEDKVPLLSGFRYKDIWKNCEVTRFTIDSVTVQYSKTLSQTIPFDVILVP